MTKTQAKTVLITGGAGGIGLCLAREFGRAGYTLLLSDLTQEGLARAAEELGKLGYPVHTWTVDVTDRARVNQVAREILERFGRLDVLVNNAGVGHFGELRETGLQTWDKLIQVNFFGPLNHINAFLPSMMEHHGGRIVNVSSGQAFFRLPTWGAYAAVKTALGVMSEILRYEVARYGVKVTTVYPYMVNTGFYHGMKGDTLGAKLAMKLVPLYSQSPKTVAKRIFKAAEHGRGIEMVSPLNTLMQLMRLLPVVPGVVYSVADLVLAGTADKGDKHDEAA